MKTSVLADERGFTEGFLIFCTLSIPPPQEKEEKKRKDKGSHDGPVSQGEKIRCPSI